MKNTLILLSITVLIIGAIVARAQTTQPQPYKVVFDLTSSDPVDQQAVLRWIKEITAVNPKTEAEVVMYAKGLDLVISSKSTQSAAVNDAMTNLHANFKVCAIAMKNQQVEKGQLLQNV